MRSATSSAYPRTAMTCGSIIWCTPMKLGPTTFQCTCFSVRCRSLYVASCFCRSLATSLPGRALRPGMVNCGITNSFGYAGYLRARIPRVTAPQSTTRTFASGIMRYPLRQQHRRSRRQATAHSRRIRRGRDSHAGRREHGVMGIPRQGCPGLQLADRPSRRPHQRAVAETPPTRQYASARTPRFAPCTCPCTPRSRTR